METINLLLEDDEFIQITDGTNNAFMQSARVAGQADAIWCLSESQPAANAACNTLNNETGWASPLVVWAKSRSGQTLVILNRW